MAIINQSNILNLQPGITAPVVVHMSEGDSGTKLSFKLVDGARAWTDPGNVVAAVHGTRQDGTQFGPYACTISGDVVSFQTDAAIAAVAGSGIAQIVLTDSDQNTAGTANFAVLVERATFPMGVTYTNDKSVYEAILAYVQTIPAQVTRDYTTKIEAEISARIAADTSLQNQITAEVDARANQDSVLSARMDEFTKLPDGSLSTAADAELVDIRVMANGTTAATAGDAVREQFSEIKNDLTLFKGGKYELLKGSFVNGSLTAGNLVQALKYRVAETEIISYDRDITLNIASGYKVGVHFFVNGSFSSDSGWKTDTYYIAAGTTFKIVIAKTTEDTSSTADVLAFRSAVTFTSVIDDITKKSEQHAWTIDDIKNVLTWQVGGLDASGRVNNLQTWRLRTTLSVVPYDITITKENGFQFRIITFDDASMTNPVQSDWYAADGATFEISAGTYFKILALWTGHDSVTYAIDDIATSFVFNAVHIYKTGCACLANQKKIDAIKTFNPCFASVSHQGYSTTGQAVGYNKISSYIGSFKHGFDIAETDIQFSSDGVPVCCHDASFVDSNNGSTTVVIADYTVAELKAYGYYGETIATLAEVVETCKMYGLKLELDKIDASGNWTDSQWQSIFDVVATYQMQDHIIWTIPYNSNAKFNRILAFNPRAKIMMNVRDLQLLDSYITWMSSVLTNDCEIIFAVDHVTMTVDELKAYNLRLAANRNVHILVWTIDDPSVYKDYMPYAWGITSNKLCAKDIMF